MECCLTVLCAEVFVASGVMQMVEEGLVGLQDEVNFHLYLPLCHTMTETVSEGEPVAETVSKREAVAETVTETGAQGQRQ